MQHISHWICIRSTYKPAQLSGSSFFSLDVRLIAFRYLWFILRLIPLTISSSLFSTLASGFGPLQPPVTRTILGSTVSWNKSPTLSNLNPAYRRKNKVHGVKLYTRNTCYSCMHTHCKEFLMQYSFRGLQHNNTCINIKPAILCCQNIT